MRRGFLVFVLVLLSFVCGYAKRSDLPKYIRDQLHNNITYTVITGRNLDTLPKMCEKVKPHHFMVLQVLPQNFKKEDAQLLLDWVKRGGVLWFYDSRLAPYFQMENSPLCKKKVEGKPYEGDYGATKVKGINTIAHALPFAKHDIKKGVQSIQVFLMKVGKDKYSAVSSKTKGVIPVFQVNLEPKAVVALKKIGKGWVIFKPLLWPDVLGGERFQVNLMEFSGGYSVPDGGKEIIPRKALEGKPVKLSRYDSLILSNGQQIVGMICEKELEFMASEGTRKEKVSNIKSIRFLPTGDEITLKNGKSFCGTSLFMKVKFKTHTGKSIYINKEDISTIYFNVGGENLKSKKGR